MVEMRNRTILSNAQLIHQVAQLISLTFTIYIHLETDCKVRRALATLVALLFSCPDGEHCFIRERSHWQL